MCDRLDELTSFSSLLGLKNLLFDKYLVRDLYLVAAGSIFILICILVYTRSIFITVMTILAVIFSLAIAYCFYSLVLGLKFFPFMNVLAAIVAIGEHVTIVNFSKAIVDDIFIRTIM